MPYLPAPGSETLTPKPPLEHLRERLRLTTVEEELFDDMHMLEHLSEGYQRACEQAHAVQAIAQIALDGSQEYPLPSDHYRTLSVYLNGYALDRIHTRNALREGLFGYYEYGTTIGFRPVPEVGANAFLLYARSPAAFALYSDVPDGGFPVEFHHLLVHYLRWKTFMVSGGAQRVGQATQEKQLFDLGISVLRSRTRAVNSARVPRIAHALERPRLRFAQRVANEIDVG